VSEYSKFYQFSIFYVAFDKYPLKSISEDSKTTKLYSQSFVSEFQLNFIPPENILTNDAYPLTPTLSVKSIIFIPCVFAVN